MDGCIQVKKLIIILVNKMNLNKTSNDILKFLTSINILVAIFGFCIGKTMFQTLDMFVIFTINIFMFLSLINIFNQLQLLNLFINWLYLPFYIFTFFTTKLSYKISINYPLFTLFKIDITEKIGDILIIIPIPFLCFQFYTINRLFVKKIFWRDSN